ncbi:MAG: hypothetical protein AB7H43_00155 [Acidimicrobiia bacterium]
MPEQLAQADSTTTTSTEVPRVVGDHPGTEPVVVAGAALLVTILAAGAYARWRTRRPGGPAAPVPTTGPAAKRGGG